MLLEFPEIRPSDPPLLIFFLEFDDQTASQTDDAALERLLNSLYPGPAVTVTRVFLRKYVRAR